MAIDKEMRKRIDNLLAVYLNDLEQHQAGWHSENDLQRLADWKGDLPPASGMDKSNDFMIGAVGMTREKHAKLVVVQQLIGRPHRCGDCGKGDGVHCTTCAGLGVRLMSGWVKPALALVLVAERYWPECSAAVISDRLGLSMKQYEGRLARARDEMARELTTIDQVRRLINAAERMRMPQHDL